MSNAPQELVYAEDPIWINKVWLDTVIIAGLTCFILCLMGLSKVSTSKMGMIYGITGMAAMIVVFWTDATYTYGDGGWLIAVSMAPGAAFGLYSAYVVAMTALPEMVGAYNGFGGLAAALTGYGLYLDPSATSLVRNGQIQTDQTNAMLWVQGIACILSIIIGVATFTGSCIAVCKLHGTIASKPRVIPYRAFASATMGLTIVVFGALAFIDSWNNRQEGIAYLTISGVVSGLYGIQAVMAIGGGDMPVSISFLNSLSGFSTSAAGFMLSNTALVVAGAFVGCSGLILTLVMCNSMNRSISNVLMGNFGNGDGTLKKSGSTKVEDQGIAQEMSAEDVVEALTSARSVIIVPGYGMAVAKAQHSVKELTTRLRARGIQVRFAIHPVAGRMPGHMNVLLAEAQLPYDITLAMDDINHDFSNTDVVLCCGANDIINPSAEDDPSSPIAGMPVLQVWKARQTIVMKRSLRVGYAGIDNPLFTKENNAMFLGDAKQSIDKVIALLGKNSLSDSSDSSGTHSHVSDLEAPIPTHHTVTDRFIADIPTLLSKCFLKVGVVKELDEGERRVAITPSGAKRLLKAGIHIMLETGAGDGADFYDNEYEDAGASIITDLEVLYDTADVIVKISAPSFHPKTQKHEIDMVRKGCTFISFLYPRTESGKELMERAELAGVNLLAVDAIPRISRAQSLDVLSSQAKIAGYRAVLEAAAVYQKFLQGETTSAGSFPPSTVLVVGAGVAGLAAASAASRLGAVVRAFDTRLETKEQVESVGAEFLILEFGEEGSDDMSGYAQVMSDEFLEKEMSLFYEQAKEVDIIITTAAIPGSKAPVLIEEDAVKAMKPGSVIVDLAGASGGNCALTCKGQTYVYENGVTIIGSDMSNQQMAWQASTMYSNNIVNLFGILCRENEFSIDMNDQVVRGMTCCHNGEITFPPPVSVMRTRALERPKSASPVTQVVNDGSIIHMRVFDLACLGEFICIGVGIIFFAIVAVFAPITFAYQLGYFILAGFLGYYLIWNVDSALFSPLMSVSNALSGIVIIGGMLLVSLDKGSPASVLGCLATSVASINVYGGFAVSYRMLLMFKKEKLNGKSV